MNKIRVRYAPSPTGQLHIGGARTALFNYLYAKKHNGDFVVRIEDTDIDRNIKNGEKSQLDNLAWLGILVDESPENPNPQIGKYRQSERLEIYKKYSDQLLKEKKAYLCYCTSEELKAEREKQIFSKLPPRYSGKCKNLSEDEIKEKTQKPAIRIVVPANQDFMWEDIVRGNISVKGKEFGDWVIVKNNGIPTYNFAVVVDDHYFKISHVFRGEEHISNTPKQIHLYQLLNWDQPRFGHMTLITNFEGKKLSKRDGNIIQFIEQYKDLGYIPQAIFNFLALLGWSPEGEEEIFSHKDFCKIFNEKRLSKSPSKFDVEKLEWINSVYMKNISNEQYLKLVIPYAKEQYNNIDFTNQKNKAKLLLYKNEIKAGFEIIDKITLFFNNNFKLSNEAREFLVSQPKHTEIANIFLESIVKIDWTMDEITRIINSIKVEQNVKGKNLFMPIRIAATGQIQGPELKQTIFLLGKDKILSNNID